MQPFVTRLADDLRERAQPEGALDSYAHAFRNSRTDAALARAEHYMRDAALKNDEMAWAEACIGRSRLDRRPVRVEFWHEDPHPFVSTLSLYCTDVEMSPHRVVYSGHGWVVIVSAPDRE